MNKMKHVTGRIILIVAVGLILIALGLYRYWRQDSGFGESYVRPAGDTVLVAIEMSPLTYTFVNDTAAGFDYEILKDISARHGVPMKFHPVGDLQEAFSMLYRGKYDMLVASMPSTSKLKRYFPLTDEIYLDNQVLVQRRDSAGNISVTSAPMLMGDTVYLAQGSPFMTRINNMCRELGDTVYVRSLPEYTSEHLALMTASGDIPRAVVSGAVARRIARERPELDVSVPLSLTQFQVWAVAPGDTALLDSLNSWIGSFKATEQYRELAAKYLRD